LKENLLELDENGLKGLVVRLGLPGYAAAQIGRWLYVSGADSFDEMTNISRSNRKLLSDAADIIPPVLIERLVSADATEKYLFELADGERVG